MHIMYFDQINSSMLLALHSISSQSFLLNSFSVFHYALFIYLMYSYNISPLLPFLFLSSLTHWFPTPNSPPLITRWLSFNKVLYLLCYPQTSHILLIWKFVLLRKFLPSLCKLCPLASCITSMNPSPYINSIMYSLKAKHTHLLMMSYNLKTWALQSLA
jgi:hypothetical protein